MKARDARVDEGQHLAQKQAGEQRPARAIFNQF